MGLEVGAQRLKTPLVDPARSNNNTWYSYDAGHCLSVRLQPLQMGAACFALGVLDRGTELRDGRVDPAGAGGQQRQPVTW